MRNIFFILFLFPLFLSSCYDYPSDIEVKPGESKLVLNAYLSPSDTVIVVKVSQSMPTLGPVVDPNVYDALVYMTDGTDTFYLNYNFNNQAYTSLDKIKPNTKYTINASCPDGRWAEANITTLADAALDFDYTIDSAIAGGNVYYTVNMVWKDSTAYQQSYYRVDAELSYLLIDTVNQIYNFIQEELTPSKKEIMPGEGLNRMMSIQYQSNLAPRHTSKFLTLHLLSIDEDYYKFELMKKNNNGGFPNYEYTQLYSNVKNGFGIIATYHNYIVKPININ